ncbi:hypothetical protein HW571_15535 [Agrobacterium genomosp. 3]|uniref:hypothetical protein n=1 Tax=Rhizobium/Agrobacterium group TaxID=227290 RepID=UPI001CD88FCE|nr:hypothetical protein [Rhizobium rhizogenes]MCA1867098.1 hypothetical protein [Agrobacterium tomkonis]MCA1877450.1 hypothetical protein [Agrobacterium tumefaciens]MCA1890016.1 hypothetical protein [Agrobacterium tomkonis]
MPLSADYLYLIAGCSFVLIAYLWLEWQTRIRPLLLSSSEIKRLADNLTERHGERAEEFASMEEDRAWRYSRSFEQGKWRRVRRELECRNNIP